MGSVLFLLLALGVTGSVGTQQNRTVEFSIEELLLLNRQFLDFLIVYDVSSIVQPSDHRCLTTMQQLSTAYLNRERHGLECE